MPPLPGQEPSLDPAAAAAAPAPRSFLDRFDTRSALAYLIVIFFLVLVILLAVKQPDGDAFKLALGALLGSATTVVGWYFGSSKGSDDKTAALLTKP